MLSFLIFCSLESPEIFHSQLIFAVRILFTPCFRIVQNFDSFMKMGCMIIASYILAMITCLCFRTSFFWKT